MTTIPGRCLSCGAAVAVDNLFDIDGSRGLTFENCSTAEACPHCGGDVRMVDGTFDVKGDILSIVRAPGWTYETLRELRHELEWALHHLPEDPDAAIERVEKVSPEVGSLIRRTMTHELYQPTMVLIGTLVAVLGFILAGMTYGQAVAQNPTLEQRVEEEMDRALREQQDSDHSGGLRHRDLQLEPGDDVDRHGDALDQ